MPAIDGDCGTPRSRAIAAMTALEQARAHFEAGEFGRAREAAVDGPRASRPTTSSCCGWPAAPASRSGADDAVDQLSEVTELQPDSAEAWRDLGDALAAEGRTDEASDAFRKVLEIEPEDEAALTALGHTAFQAGQARRRRVDARAGGRPRGAAPRRAAISLVDMYRTLGQPEEALAAARRVAEADPDEPARRARRGRAGARDGQPRRGGRRLRAPQGARRPARRRGRRAAGR